MSTSGHSSKRASLKTVLPKLQKLLAHLGNDNDGEVVNAVRAASRLLKSAQLDWHDLVALMAEGPESLAELLMKMLFKPKDPDLLVNLALARATFFHTRSGEVYAIIDRQTCPVEPKGKFGDWAISEFIKEQHRGCTEAAVKTAVRSLCAITRREGERHDVHIRTAACGDKIYIDLANDAEEVVEIDAAGWRVIDDAPVKFLRPNGMAELPKPERGGSIELLRPYVNLTDSDFLLFIQLLVDALHQRAERPVGLFQGGEGSGKTSLSKIAQQLLDPRSVDPGNPPTTVRELTVA